MLTFKTILTTATVLGLSYGAANATVYDGTATFLDTTNNNNLTVTGNPNPAPFTSGDLTAGQSATDRGFITLSTTDSSNGIQSDNLSLTFTFTDPASQTVSDGGSASELVIKALGILDNGAITWNGATHVDSNGIYVQTLVKFDDGAEAYLDLYDTSLSGSSSSRAAQVDVKIVDVKDPTAVPEPASIAILGAGLFGIGMIRRNRRA